MKKLSAIIIVAVALTACNNSSSSSERTDTSTTVAPAPVDTTTMAPAPAPDTSAILGQSVKRSAVLGYSAFKTMRQHETRNINVWVSIINPAAKVIDTLRQLNSSDLPVRKSDTATYFSENVSVYRYLDIKLIDPNKDFDITQIHDSSRQEIDSLADCHWQWAVTPHTDKSRATLMLKVVAEGADGSHKPFTEQNIVIDISLDRNIGRPLFSWLRDNPEKLLVLIIIPLIAFFWKQIVALFGRKPKKE